MQVKCDATSLDDSKLLVEDMRSAVQGINKNSRLRTHYLKLAMMSNIMRAFMHFYEVDKEFESGQLVLLDTLKRVESRKERNWFTADKIALQEAFTLFTAVMESMDNGQLLEIMQFIDSNSTSSKWLIFSKK